MKKKFVKTAAACGLCLTLLASGVSAGAAYSAGVQNRIGGNNFFGQQAPMLGDRQNGPFGGMEQGGMSGRMQSSAQYASAPTEIAAGITANSAASLTADEANATTITMSEENSEVKIKASGTYIITGSCSDGSITVTKGTTGVVLILRDLDLTSATGATLSVNKAASAKIIVSGSVTLTDAEDNANEASDDYDGAAIKIKAGASAYITGSGTLTLNGEAKNGIKVSGGTDDDEGYGNLVIDGATVNINAANDGINANYDVAILSGKVTVSAADDGIHADHILTIGSESAAPTVTVTSSTEALEATVINIAGGTVNVTASDDGVNAANADGLFKGALDYSINITGGSVTVNAGTDGLDSNGNINLISGSATIRSANNGGDAGIDYDGQCYISDEFELNNYSGVAGPDNMMGGPGQMGRMDGMQQSGGQPRNGQQSRNTDRQGANQAQQFDQNRNSMRAPAQNGAMGGMTQNQPNGPTQNQQNPFGAPDQGMSQTPMQNQGMMGGANNQNGGMRSNGGQVPFWLLQQITR